MHLQNRDDNSDIQFVHDWLRHAHPQLTLREASYKHCKVVLSIHWKEDWKDINLTCEGKANFIVKLNDLANCAWILKLWNRFLFDTQNNRFRTSHSNLWIRNSIFWTMNAILIVTTNHWLVSSIASQQNYHYQKWEWSSESVNRKVLENFYEI